MLSSAFATTITVADENSKELTITQEQLLQLPQRSIITELPWIEGKSTFTGVYIEDLLNIVDKELPSQILIIALNSYNVTIPKSDFIKYKPIIAIKKDNQFMSIRNKGPFWLIFPLSELPSIDNVDYHAKMIWQISRIEL
jgi:hypothetical protein